MKKIVLFCIAGLFLALAVSGPASPAVAALPNLYIHPSPVTAEPDSTFKVDLRISGARDVFAWQVTLGWNSSVLDFVNATEGSFLKGIEGNPTQWFNRTYQDQVGNDTIVIGAARLGWVLGVDGSGVLATIAFRVEAKGETPLYLTQTMLADSRPTPYPIEHTATDGLFSNIFRIPVASFTMTPSIALIGETVIFDASASYDPEGTIDLYSWDFGDGGNYSAIDAFASHAYSEGGAYEVTLKVTNDLNYNNTLTRELKVRYAYDVAITSVTLSDLSVAAGDKVTITVIALNDGSQTASFNVTVYYSLGGGEALEAAPAKEVNNLAMVQNSVLTFEWNTAGVEPGDYRIEAVADTVPGEVDTTDNVLLGGIVTLTADVTRPVADAGSNRAVNEDSAVVLDGSASSDNVGIATYRWTFTDVTTITLIGPTSTYVFSTPGVYSITLRVTDAAGNWDEDMITITVNDVTKPEADAGQDQIINAGIVLTLNASDSTDNVGIVIYEWDFGDQTTGAGKTTTHSYAASGTYTVKLTVEDAAGNTETDTITVTVLSNDPPAWMIGAAVAAIATTAIVIASVILLRKRK